jgi:zinc and cadmium transporter
MYILLYVVSMTDIWTWIYTLISVGVVSLISLIGLLTLPIKEQKLRSLLLYLVSFSAGALFADAFIHLIPEAVEASGNGLELKVPIYILSGIVASFILEKFIQWRHCHIPTSEEHPHPFAYMNLFGDGAHNFIDGLIVAGSYAASFPVLSGLGTTLAVVFHEIPQEIGDYGVLLHGGFSKNKALLFNFLTALTAVLGALLALALSGYIEGFKIFLLSFAAGEFIYIAGSDLVPELHKETKPSKSMLQLIAFISGMVIILCVALVE